MPGSKRYFQANEDASSSSPKKSRARSTGDAKRRGGDSAPSKRDKRGDKDSKPKESFIAAGLKQYTEAAEAAAAAKQAESADGQEDKISHHTTLYLTHLPSTLTSPQLTLIFSSYAPLRAAFVVSSSSGPKPSRGDVSSANTLPLGPGRDRTGKSVSRGFGYVRFVLRADAEKCLEEWGKAGIPRDAMKDLETVEGLENVDWDKLCGRNGAKMSWAKKKLKEGEKPEGVVKPKRETQARAVSAEEKKQSIDRNAPRSVLVFGLPSPSQSDSKKTGETKEDQDEDTSMTVADDEADDVGSETGKDDDETKSKDWAKALKQKTRKFGTVEAVRWPVMLPSRQNAAIIVMSSPREAHEVMKRLNNHVFRGHLVSAAVKSSWDLTQRLGQAKGGGRLVVRNLTFDITVEDLRAVFARFGPLHSINLPVNETTGKARGFAFVYFVTRSHAEKALEAVNGTRIYAGMAQERIASEGGKEGKKKEIRQKKKAEGALPNTGEKGRLVAVDWALGKNEWEKTQQGDTAEDVEAATSVSDEVTDEDSEEEESDEEDEDSDLEPIALGAEDDEEEEEPAVEDEEIDADSDEDRDDDDDKGMTLFVRNLSFEATEAEVYDLFKQFGPLRYARVVYDPTTKRSRGTAFVHFWNQDDAHEVLRESESLNAGLFVGETSDKKAKATKSMLMADPTSSSAAKLTLHGRVLAAVPAVSKDDADKLREDRDKKGGTKTDRRNLYLMREGVIFPTWPLAKTLHPADMNARQMSFEARKALLRSNPSLYVSRTRLSIRQIPLYVTDGMLKRLANWAAKEFERDVKSGERKALTKDELQTFVIDASGVAPPPPTANEKGIPPSRVKQSKILRQNDRVDPLTGLGRSKGYGFLELNTHADALRVLRWANANKDVGHMFRKWWRESLEDMIAKAEKGDGQIGRGVTIKDKDERVKRLKEKMAELQEEEKAAQERDAKREAEGRSTGEPSRSAKTLIIEFSIENAVTTKRRAEKVERARERAKRAKDPAAVEDENEVTAEDDGEEKQESPQGKKRRGSMASTGGKPGPKGGKKAKVEAGAESVDGEKKAGQSIGGLIGRKRKERRQKGKGGR